ncbi:Aca2/YdiL-like domain-containing protein [Rhodococcus zopfii]|uniref:Aca2/YdiL-like domain-containing protein n=1 Tax=Rhodococcus zopfii TaxID=43772 RepID=UPI000935282A|nr:DUF1870 family protein [Rhodococcus zopfii]
MRTPTATGAMTDAELRVTRERLGLSADWLSDHLGVQIRTWRRWEGGTAPIPTGVRDAITAITAAALQLTAALAASARETGQIVTYRNDAAYRAAEPDSTYPSGWHRAAAAAAAESAGTDVSVVYHDVPVDQ